MGHKFSGFPRAVCLRCNAIQAEEIAVANGWLTFGADGMEWISENHQRLVSMCDDHCFTDINDDQKAEFKDDIQDLCKKAGIDETMFSTRWEKVTGHKWSGWAGAYCLRCGGGQVMEVAVTEGWIKFGHDEVDKAGIKTTPDKWKSPKHKELVDLCDGNCYADMTKTEVAAHKAKVKELEKELGIK